MTDGKLWSDVPIDQPLFEANPPVLVFRNDRSRDRCTAIVQLRNIDKVMTIHDEHDGHGDRCGAGLALRSNGTA